MCTRSRSGTAIAIGHGRAFQHNRWRANCPEGKRTLIKLLCGASAALTLVIGSLTAACAKLKATPVRIMLAPMRHKNSVDRAMRRLCSCRASGDLASSYPPVDLLNPLGALLRVFRTSRL